MKLPRPRFSLRTLAIFTLLATSGFGLWWHWEPWSCEANLEIEGALISVEFLPGDQSIRLRYGWVQITMPGLPLYNGQTAELVPSRPGDAQLHEKTSVHRMPNGEAMSSTNWTTRELGVRENPFAASTMARCVSADGRWSVLCESGTVRLFRRRPEWWWGVFWLWEFWLTVGFAGLLGWSVYRDRKALSGFSVNEN